LLLPFRVVPAPCRGIMQWEFLPSTVCLYRPPPAVLLFLIADTNIRLEY
jgi:hypothetical protein